MIRRAPRDSGALFYYFYAFVAGLVVEDGGYHGCSEETVC